MMSGGNLNAVFYADAYHPIQAGSIDGTDIVPHDNGVYRAVLCSAAGLYDPFGDPKVIGDPFCNIFVGRLSRQTSEETLRKAMSTYGRVKKLRLVRDIVTGSSCGYAFVEFETEREMRHAYLDAHHSIIDDCEVIVDYNRQQLMAGWIPRRLGGGLGGKKESGQLRFGGRERPFRAPLRPIPYDGLERLGIPPPPQGRFMSRFQVPSPPRRVHQRKTREDSPPRHRSKEVTPPRQRSSRDVGNREASLFRFHGARDREDTPPKWRGDSHSSRRRLDDGEESSLIQKSNHASREDDHHHRRYVDKDSIKRRRRSPLGESDSMNNRHGHHNDRSHRSRKRSPS